MHPFGSRRGLEDAERRNQRVEGADFLGCVRCGKRSSDPGGAPKVHPGFGNYRSSAKRARQGMFSASQIKTRKRVERTSGTLMVLWDTIPGPWLRFARLYSVLCRAKCSRNFGMVKTLHPSCVELLGEAPPPPAAGTECLQISGFDFGFWVFFLGFVSFGDS